MTKRLPSGADSAVAAADLRWMRFDRARVFSWAQTIGIIVLLAVIFATPGFLAGPSILSLLTTVSFIGCVAIGMTLITISGNIMSFALGAVGVTAMVFILASNWLGFGLGLVFGLLFGSLLTGLQGLMIGWVRANPIIVSIAASPSSTASPRRSPRRARSTPIRASSRHRSKERWAASRSSLSCSCSLH
jgi:predicted ABC-type sugar transport system permease subunit